ncbi:MAG: YsnF/AvaK domain-containing protein [Pedobacter sp.]
MSRTVIGIFETLNQAQEAKSYLQTNGFSSEHVDISNGTGTSYDGSSADTNEQGFGDRIGNFFKNMFDDEDEASSHTAAARNGITVTVHARTEDETLQAVQILDNFGALDVNEFSERSKIGGNAATVIPVIEEELHVGKKEVETGGVRLRSRIVERPVEESIRLREEHVNIERTPVDRLATSADFDGLEGTVELTETAERAVVAKEARVVEEVSLDKEVTEREETISDTVRHTEVDTEEIPGTERTFRDRNDQTTL